MKNITFLALLVFNLAACSGGGGDYSITQAWEPGIYEGSFTQTGDTPTPVKVIVTSSAGFALMPDTGEEYAIGTVNGNKLTTTDGFSATLTGTLSGNYSAPGVNGTFSLTDSGIYNHGSSMTTTSGVWVDQVFTDNTGTTTWAIDSNGVIDFSSVSGCTGTGSITPIDTSANEYTVNVNLSNCTGFNGLYSGYAWTSDGAFTDDVLHMIVENTGLQTFGTFEAIKQ